MPISFRTLSSRVGLGMASLVLGVIALLLFFLPILGIPLAAFGALFGLVGLTLALADAGQSLRWNLAGLLTSLLALGVNLAVAYAPGGYPGTMHDVRPWEPVSANPYVSPPAPSGWGD